MKRMYNTNTHLKIQILYVSFKIGICKFLQYIKQLIINKINNNFPTKTFIYCMIKIRRHKLSIEYIELDNFKKLLFIDLSLKILPKKKYIIGEKREWIHLRKKPAFN